MLGEKKTEKINGNLIRIKSENEYVLVLVTDFLFCPMWMKMKTKRKHATERLLTIYLQGTVKLQLKVLELSDFSRGISSLISLDHLYHVKVLKFTSSFLLYDWLKESRAVFFSARKRQSRRLKLKCKTLDIRDKHSSLCLNFGTMSHKTEWMNSEYNLNLSEY